MSVEIVGRVKLDGQLVHALRNMFEGRVDVQVDYGLSGYTVTFKDLSLREVEQLAACTAVIVM